VVDEVEIKFEDEGNPWPAGSAKSVPAPALTVVICSPEIWIFLHQHSLAATYLHMLAAGPATDGSIATVQFADRLCATGPGNPMRELTVRFSCTS
jgi:hypothetical protein